MYSRVYDTFPETHSTFNTQKTCVFMPALPFVENDTVHGFDRDMQIYSLTVNKIYAVKKSSSGGPESYTL